MPKRPPRRPGPSAGGRTARPSARTPEARGEVLDGREARVQQKRFAKRPSGLKRGPRPPAAPGQPGPYRDTQRPAGAGRTGGGSRPRLGERPGSGRDRLTAAGGAPFAPMRIAKAMARAGLCSRRDAERWIAEGRVAVNGETLTSPARDVGPRDRIIVDGLPLPEAEPVRLWRYHKPKGCVTTHKDPEGRQTVFDRLPRHLPRVISIGRLDFNTEGLLLLTNDGALARHLELPATGWLRRYRVRAFGTVTQAALDALKDGIEIAGVRYGPIEASLDQVQGSNVWLTIGLREGKNREVRNILGALNLTVNRLIRVSFGPFQLLDLPEGEAEHVARRVLADQLGRDVARGFGLVDRDEEPADGRAPRKPRGTDKT